MINTNEKLYCLVIKDAKTIPDFINAKSTQHKQAYDIINQLLVLISELVVPYFKTDKAIVDFYFKFLDVEMALSYLESNSLYILCVDHIDKLIKKYITASLEYEDFETHQNLKKLESLRNADFFGEEKTD
jgi:hypothetical protein